MTRFEPAGLLAWSMATAALSFADIQSPVRTGFALVFLAVVPGLAVTRMLRFPSTVRLLLAIPVSLSLAALTSAALVYGAYPSWDLGLSVLLALVIGAVATDLARGSLPSQTLRPHARAKLDEEWRQARLIQSLGNGSTLPEAAEAAGVTMATLQRALRKSDQLRKAVSVVTHGELDATDGSIQNESRARGRGRIAS